VARHVYDARGEVLAALAWERRSIVAYDDLPLVVQNAVLAAEDKRFFSHSGVDPLALPRVSAAQTAFAAALKDSEAGEGAASPSLARTQKNGTSPLCTGGHMVTASSRGPEERVQPLRLDPGGGGIGWALEAQIERGGGHREASQETEIAWENGSLPNSCAWGCRVGCQNHCDNAPGLSRSRRSQGELRQGRGGGVREETRACLLAPRTGHGISSH
jgi:hypothetical protein